MNTMKAPTIGSKVIVKTKFSQGASMIPKQSTEIVFEGTVLNSYKWMTDREFCLSGDSDWPIRVVNMSQVIDIKLIEGELRSINLDTKIWNVSGSKGSKYVVTKNSSKWDCTCPGFGFRKTCKHVSELSRNIG
jgi:hypothetical protein